MSLLLVIVLRTHVWRNEVRIIIKGQNTVSVLFSQCNIYSQVKSTSYISRFFLSWNSLSYEGGNVFPHSRNQKLTVTNDISHEMTKSSHFLNISVGECVFCTQEPTRDPFTNKAQFSLWEKRVQGLANLFLATGITCLIWQSLSLYFFSKGVNSFFSQNPNLFHKLRKLLWD